MRAVTIIPLVDDLEILGIFKDKDKEEGDSITVVRRVTACSAGDRPRG